MKKNIKITSETDTKDLPLASIVIKDYQDTKIALTKSLKAVSLIAILLLVMLAIETTYIIIYWDSLHPYAGAITESN